MAENLKKLDSENEKLISQVIDSTTLEDKIIAGIVKVGMVSNPDLKEVIKVSLVKGVNKFLAAGTNTAIQVNEDVFDRLTDEQQVLAIKHAVHCVKVNENSGAITLLTPDLVTYSDFIEKVDIADIIVLNESIKSIKDALKKKSTDD